MSDIIRQFEENARKAEDAAIKEMLEGQRNWLNSEMERQREEDKKRAIGVIVGCIVGGAIALFDVLKNKRGY